jgi:hypothetical protein
MRPGYGSLNVTLKAHPFLSDIVIYPNHMHYAKSIHQHIQNMAKQVRAIRGAKRRATSLQTVFEHLSDHASYKWDLGTRIELRFKGVTDIDTTLRGAPAIIRAVMPCVRPLFISKRVWRDRIMLALARCEVDGLLKAAEATVLDLRHQAYLATLANLIGFANDRIRIDADFVHFRRFRWQDPTVAFDMVDGLLGATPGNWYDEHHCFLSADFDYNEPKQSVEMRPNARRRAAAAAALLDNPAAANPAGPGAPPAAGADAAAPAPNPQEVPPAPAQPLHAYDDELPAVARERQQLVARDLKGMIRRFLYVVSVAVPLGGAGGQAVDGADPDEPAAAPRRRGRPRKRSRARGARAQQLLFAVPAGHRLVHRAYDHRGIWKSRASLDDLIEEVANTFGCSFASHLVTLSVKEAKERDQLERQQRALPEEQPGQAEEAVPMALAPEVPPADAAVAPPPQAPPQPPPVRRARGAASRAPQPPLAADGSVNQPALAAEGDGAPPAAERDVLPVDQSSPQEQVRKRRKKNAQVRCLQRNAFALTRYIRRIVNR